MTEPVIVSAKSGYTVEYSTNPRYAKVGDIEVPTVTKVLDVLNKPALPWWGMRIGVDGCLKVLGQEDFDPTINLTAPTTDEVIERLTANQLTVNHQRDKAGTRGHNVHSWIQAIIEGTPLPELTEEEKKYVKSFTDWYEANVPDFIETEVVVGSEKHLYAGRFDAVMSMEDGQYWLVDFKTSKAVYDPYMIQVEAYEEARVEMGGDPTDKRGILHLQRNGKPAKLVESVANFQDFAPILETYERLEGIKARKKLIARGATRRRRGRKSE